MDQILIRKATSLDLEALLIFEQGVIAGERPFDVTLKEGHINYYNLKEMIGLANTEIIVVVELNKEIIASGYARIENSKPYLSHDKHAYLGFMYVSPTHRGQRHN